MTGDIIQEAIVFFRMFGVYQCISSEENTTTLNMLNLIRSNSDVRRILITLNQQDMANPRCLTKRVRKCSYNSSCSWIKWPNPKPSTCCSSVNLSTTSSIDWYWLYLYIYVYIVIRQCTLWFSMWVGPTPNFLQFLDIPEGNSPRFRDFSWSLLWHQHYADQQHYHRRWHRRGSPQVAGNSMEIFELSMEVLNGKSMAVKSSKSIEVFSMLRKVQGIVKWTLFQGGSATKPGCRIQVGYIGWIFRKLGHLPERSRKSVLEWHLLKLGVKMGCWSHLNLIHLTSFFGLRIYLITAQTL